MIRPATDEREHGAALVLALVFLSLFGLAVAAVLAFADSDLRGSRSVQDQREVVFAADGAVESVIGTIRPTATVGVDAPGTCAATTVPAVNAESVTVTCTPQPGSGLGGGGGGGSPASAILTLSQDPTELGIRQLSNSLLNINGDVISNSAIQVDAANTQMNVQGKVTARGTCTTSKITATPGPVTCGVGSGAIANSSDPNYPPAVSLPPAVASVPACSSSVARFSPGTYNSATALNTSMGCAGVLWFQPGVYYFNFTNGGTHVWTINNSNLDLVAGMPNGWNPASPTRPVLPFPGGCKTGTDPAPNDGIQFIFGGDSRISILAGQVELCAQPSAADPQIAIYGSKGTQTPGSATLVPTGAGATSFSNIPGAYTIGDGQTATASDGTVSITLTGFVPPAIPAGSSMTTIARITHRETGDVSGQSLEVAKGGTSCSLPGLTARDPMGEDSFDLSSCLTAPDDLAALTATYKVTSKKNKIANAELDGIAFDVTWLSPGLVPQSGCITAPGYAAIDGGHCPLVATDGAQTNVAIAGTIYAPLAPLDIQLTNAAAQFISRGVISRVLWTAITPASGFAGAVFAIPSPGGPRQPRKVQLTASIAGVPKLRALITIDDGPDGLTPGRTVTVNQWTVLR